MDHVVQDLYARVPVRLTSSMVELDTPGGTGVNIVVTNLDVSTNSVSEVDSDTTHMVGDPTVPDDDLATAIGTTDTLRGGVRNRQAVEKDTVARSDVTYLDTEVSRSIHVQREVPEGHVIGGVTGQAYSPSGYGRISLDDGACTNTPQPGA